MPLNIVTEDIEKGNMRQQRRYIGYFCVCIKTDVFEDKNARILQNL